jgi:hypothetical protein
MGWTVNNVCESTVNPCHIYERHKCLKPYISITALTKTTPPSQQNVSRMHAFSTANPFTMAY